ncbi:hypothetical protein [Massilia sp. Se16.2.3]|uniref:hypothetical protein n=1 Tax=Massilia sp. Se16.2.3 TaxID=2709303 RepID=UPI001601CBC6|nr:hypothetical protein [Massilia sp. Se16.2.3]QNA99704.1 hypothetical protein G4G31_14130 [Massilia sp. Se16.2.3]
MAVLKGLQEAQPEAQALLKKYNMHHGSLRLEEARNPRLRTVLSADPGREWRAVRAPVLALNGSLDHRYRPRKTSPALRRPCAQAATAARTAPSSPA